MNVKKLEQDTKRFMAAVEREGRSKSTVYITTGDEIALNLVGEKPLVFLATTSCMLERTAASVWGAVERGWLIPQGLTRFEWEMRRAAALDTIDTHDDAG